MDNKVIVFKNNFFQFKTVIDIPKEDRIIPIDYYHYVKEFIKDKNYHHNVKNGKQPIFNYSLYNAKTKIRTIDDKILIAEIKNHYEYLKLKYA